MRPIIRVMLASLLCVLGTRAAQADLLCQVTFVCYYESPGFHFKVVDKETGQPLADVHALAEWVMYGGHGRNGPLMVQDATSGQNGDVLFPAWGPLRGPRAGLVLNQDPLITLFRLGYKTLLIQNAYPEGIEETTRVRRFGQDGQKIALELFRGTNEEWIQQLEAAAWGSAAGRSDDQSLRFRAAYLNRFNRIWDERLKFSPTQQSPGQFFWHVEREIRFLKGGQR